MDEFSRELDALVERFREEGEWIEWLVMDLQAKIDELKKEQGRE